MLTIEAKICHVIVLQTQYKISLEFFSALLSQKSMVSCIQPDPAYSL